MKSLVTAAALLLAAGSLEAQVLVRNDTLDAERRDVRDVLIVLRDSLRTVEASAAQFERGNESASVELLYSRGRSLLRACSRSLQNVPPAQALVRADDWENDYHALRQNELLAAMDRLEKSLQACESVWGKLATMEGADDIRTEGVAEARAITDAVHQYGNAVASFFKALDIYVSPIGAGPGVIP